MKKIVLVDDNADLLETFEEFIMVFNDAKCVTFLNPLDALAFISDNKDIDILITDYQMPQMNGFELVQRLLENEVKIRMIISSAHDKQTLEMLRKKYNLEGKVEVAMKTDFEFMKHLSD